MMEAQGHDRVSPTEAAESRNMDGEKASDIVGLNEQPVSAKDGMMVPSNSSQNTTTIGRPRDVSSQSGSLAAELGQRAIHSPNAYAPQTQQFYYGGYGNTPGDWGEYHPFVAAENLEFGSSGIYNDNSSLVFHGGYGYSPQMPYGPYSPVTTPIPAVRADAHVYSSPQFPFSGPPYYHQSLPPSVPYITSPTPVSQSELTIPVSIDQQGDNMLFGPRPGYPSQFGSFGRGGSFTGSSDNASFHDSRQAFDGFGSTGGPWSDWSRSSDGQRSLTPLSSPAASPQPINMLGSFGRSVATASQQQRPFYGIGSSTRSVTRGIAQNGSRQSSNFRYIAFPCLGDDERWSAFDKAKRRGREIATSCTHSSAVDILSEQNRGPRASRPRTQSSSEQLPNDANKTCFSPVEAYGQTFNQPDFITDYDDAKFFVIKSYSEDNVHKSIRYSVWASTPNGNKKLDSTYRGVEKQGTCPIFLFFSVNASAQFCGVAEMVGPVDFDKNVDYWQQDKWSGQFPVKWHMIKDVPNSQFRHIILENNDNKPVTNSRDTQEVKLEQGIEMLKIFKNYEAESSILDDLDFYEERQRLMQERKARQQAVASPIVGVGESNFMLQLPNSFEKSVRLDDSNNSEATTGNDGAGGAISASSVVGGGETKIEDNSQTVAVSSTMQNS